MFQGWGAGVDAFRHNQAVFDDPRVASSYARPSVVGSGFLDAGEQAALGAAAAACRDAAILDIGVGAGRTTALLRLISDDYIAIDYSPRMVEGFRTVHPGIDCRVADARDLGDFADGTFGLVMFSNNGIDTVDHTDRVGVLAEMGRVVSDHGVIVFSTLNKRGPSFGESPFQLRRPGSTGAGWTRELITRLARRALDPPGGVRAVRNWFAHRRLIADHQTWAVGPLAAHDFAPFVHFTSMTDLRDTIAAAGLESVAVYDEQGRVIDPRLTESTADNFTVIARRRNGSR